MKSSYKGGYPVFRISANARIVNSILRNRLGIPTGPSTGSTTSSTALLQQSLAKILNLLQVGG